MKKHNLDVMPLFKVEEHAAPIDFQPLYSSRIIVVYINMIKKNYSYINIRELLSYAGMEMYQVQDEAHWFNQYQVDSFYERLVKLTGNNNIAREAGRYSASPEAIGTMQQYLLSLFSPSKVYELVGKFATNFTRASQYKWKKLSVTSCEITVSNIQGVNEKPYQCQNRMGFLEACTAVFNYRLPVLEHEECLHKGGKCCRYVVSWQESPAAQWRKRRNYAAAALVALCAGYSLYNPYFTLVAGLPSSMLILWALTFYAMRLEVKEFKEALNNVNVSSDKLLEHIDLNYNHALLINEIGMALSKQLEVEDILANVTDILQKRLSYDRGAIFLANPEKTELVYRAGYGYTNDQFKVLMHAKFNLTNRASRGVFALCYREHRSFLINDVNEIQHDLSPHSLSFALSMGTKSFICCPIIYEHECLGVLAVDNIRTKRPLVQSDISLLMGVAPEIAISIRNAMLIEVKERQFQNILQVLAASIDARDFLTAGHSEDVTKYAVNIAREMGLGKDYCEVIRVAALLHDYGKIAIKDEILKKEGRLTADEYEEIKKHASKTREILEQINFEGIYKEVPQIAGAHHEKYNGKGYPDGLKGEQIPLGARILAVADVFEAVTAKRHYRGPMQLNDAFELLKSERDQHFDGRVLDAFFNLVNRENQKLF
ncbi:MAG: GAF and HD-GYP domain-containing protein [Dissulfurispiraceae bacterium]